MRLLRLLLLAVCVCLTGQLTFGAYQVDFSSAPGATIVFSGTNDTFTFSPGASGYDASITSANFGTTLTGQFAVITGTFQIGTIATLYNDGQGGLVQTADVTTYGTPAQLVIYDAFNNPWTADLAWNTIMSSYSVVGTNVKAQVNLTNITYAGGNSDLKALALMSDHTLTLSSQFSHLTSLTALTLNGGTSSSYSLTLAAVPEPFLIGLFPPALLAFLLYRRRSQV